MLFLDPPMARHRTQVVLPHPLRAMLRLRHGQQAARMGTAVCASQPERRVLVVRLVQAVVARVAPITVAQVVAVREAMDAAMANAAVRAVVERR